jgi:alanine racemase
MLSTSIKRYSLVEQTTNPTVAVVDLSAIAFNLRGIRKQIGKKVKLMAVVKANAYGHGANEISNALANTSVDYFGVAIAEEGVKIREHGLKKPIHVFIIPSKEQCKLSVDYNLEPTICSEREVHWLNALGTARRKTIIVHLKIDTGMNRIGVKPVELENFLKILIRKRRIEIKGVFTHFAEAEKKDKSFTLKQFDEFQRALDILRRNNIQPELIHCANSAAILDLPNTYCSMVRAGLMMYGYYPSHTTTESIPLEPSMTLKTKVSLVKRILAGESVSYGRRFIAARRTTIATVPVGYADGYSRLLTGKASVLVQGNRFPVAGTICMDQLMVDVGNANIEPGEEVVLMGKQKNDRILAYELADRMGTIPYEVLCAISPRVPRIYRTI